MAIAEPKQKFAALRRQKRGNDLVPDETTESYVFIDRAAREGRRVSTKAMTDDEVRAALLGDRTGERSGRGSRPARRTSRSSR